MICREPLLERRESFSIREKSAPWGRQFDACVPIEGNVVKDWLHLRRTPSENAKVTGLMNRIGCLLIRKKRFYFE